VVKARRNDKLLGNIGATSWYKDTGWEEIEARHGGLDLSLGTLKMLGEGAVIGTVYGGVD